MPANGTPIGNPQAVGEIFPGTVDQNGITARRRFHEELKMLQTYLYYCGHLQENSFVIWITNSILISLIVWLCHYFSLFLTIGAMTVMNLRVLGIAGSSQTIMQIVNLYSRWMWTGLVVLFVSGILMLAGDSVLFCTNEIFGIKLLVIALAAISGVLIQQGARKWDQMPSVPVGAKVLAVISLVLWIGTILSSVEVPANSGVP